MGRVGGTTTVILLLSLLGALLGSPGARAQEAPGARAIVTRAADLMGGEATLWAVERAVFDMMTQWQRTNFRDVPHTDRPSFEAHYDVRDYTIDAWRNTRDFGTRKIVNVIRDSVSFTDLGEGPQPLSAAYVDERNELFTYTPDRLILALLDAPDLSAPGDTIIGGELHHRVRGTLHGRYPSTVYFHAGSGLPTLLRFHAAHPADYGLVPWGDMQVAVWYSNWKPVGDISIPTQWDIDRVGVPYKRMTVRRASFTPDFEAADSFAVSAEQRAEYWASIAPLPMHEGRVVVPEPTAHDPGLLELGGFGLPAGAVRTDAGWLLLATGQAPYNFKQGVDALEAAGTGVPSGVVFVPGNTGNGGVVEAARRGLPIYTSPSGEAHARVMLRNAGVSAETLRAVSAQRRLGSGETSVVLAPVDLPDIPGSLMLFRPSTGWLWVPEAVMPLDHRLARDRAAELGWDVRTVGDARGFAGGG